eukprot:1196206-Prymnesium_polylepis.1
MRNCNADWIVGTNSLSIDRRLAAEARFRQHPFLARDTWFSPTPLGTLLPLATPHSPLENAFVQIHSLSFYRWDAGWRPCGWCPVVWGRLGSFGSSRERSGELLSSRTVWTEELRFCP